ncbi:unnamed protein product [Candidula unifasciata]|uniref:AB hydrolase-1 domain-containing protein n=1 Tax=Candidula unifasciata TaxID=100452 RepID=A0A8S3ZA00_9EUPU|nr:unnamed protein product [Candidula unifasciata]
MAARRIRCVLKHTALFQPPASLSAVIAAANVTSREYSTFKDRVIISAKQQVNGVDFHYEETGTGKHTVLLLPGALGTTRTDFLPQLTGLSASKYRIIALDLRGYGSSRPPDRDWPPMFYHRDADDVAVFMQALNIPRYSVLGWSDGGIVAMILAASNPASVHKLVVWGSNAYISDVDLQLYKNVQNIDDWSPKMKQPFIDVYGEEYFRKQWQGWSQAVLNYTTHRNGDICIDSLHNIQCPTLIVNGVKDPMVSQEHPAFLHKHIANSRVVDFPEGKHNLHLRFHTEFNSLVEQFLDEELLKQE